MYHVQHGDETYVCREVHATLDSVVMGAATRAGYFHEIELEGIVAVNGEPLGISGGRHSLSITKPLTITIAKES